MTHLFGQAVLMLGEIGCGSLVGLKELRVLSCIPSPHWRGLRDQPSSWRANTHSIKLDKSNTLDYHFIDED